MSRMEKYWNDIRTVAPYSFSFIPTLLVVYGNLAGGLWSVANSAFMLVFLVIIDWFVPRHAHKIPDVPAQLPDIILLCSVAAHTLAAATFAYSLHNGILQNEWRTWAAISTGLNAGLIGINTAHELIHRKEKMLQKLGIWNLFLSSYTHFYIEHRLGHHLRVGTTQDPATARYGENFYAFLVRTIPAQWLSALRIENKKNNTWLKNFVVRSAIAQLTFYGLLAYWGGLTLLLFWLLQCAIAIFLLEYVNYIEHYGLERKQGEKVNLQHAWQSDSITSRFALFELSRHADHHIKAYKPYHTLESHTEGLYLPSGYFGMFYVALIPPLWFGLMNKKEN